MSFAIVVPFRSDGSHRDAAWRWLSNRLEGWDIVEGESPSEAWVKANAVADAVSKTDADIIVVHDADVFCAGVADAIEAVELGAPWAMPHRMVHRLDLQATLEVYGGAEPQDTKGRAERHRGYFGGGIVVLPRETYLRVPLDPRFVGWGQEDRAWSLALTTLAGNPIRFDADLFHLWHLPQERLSRIVGSTEGARLCARYRAARHDPDAMRHLIDEAKEAT